MENDPVHRMNSKLNQLTYPHPSTHLPPNYTPSALIQVGKGSSHLFTSTKKLEHMNCLIEPTESMGGLYIGDVISTVKPGILQSGNIGALLTCNFQENNFHARSRSDLRLVTKIIDARDTNDYPINMHFQASYNFIQENRLQKRNVLVNCHAGVSRSGTIVCSYIIRKNKWTAERTLNFVRNKRDRVKPNAFFWEKLLQLEKQVLGKSGLTIDSIGLTNFNRAAFQIEIKRKQEDNKQQAIKTQYHTERLGDKLSLKRQINIDNTSKYKNQKNLSNAPPTKSTPYFLPMHDQRFLNSEHKILYRQHKPQSFHTPSKSFCSELQYDLHIKDPLVNLQKWNGHNLSYKQNPESVKSVHLSIGERIKHEAKIDNLSQIGILKQK